jgi:hypothetical protein
MSTENAGASAPSPTDGYPVMECTDQLNCLCWECESARVVNLRTTLIRCVRDGEMNATTRDEAKAAITHSYGTDRWLKVWGIDG